jgi:hypothetical protein
MQRAPINDTACDGFQQFGVRNAPEGLYDTIPTTNTRTVIRNGSPSGGRVTPLMARH